MSKLYSQLAAVYHEMYQGIFDYNKEYQFYHKLLKQHRCKRILEAACGTGHLAKLLHAGGYDYVGLDIAPRMIELARRNVPDARFVVGDMREMPFEGEFDAVLITGKSFTYMIKNKDVIRALQSVRKCLKKKGMFIFDNFLADEIFLNFQEEFSHEVKYKDTTYIRESHTEMNMESGWTWKWDAVYTIIEGGREETVKDHDLLRAFTRDELKLFLNLSGFDVLSTVKRGSAVICVARCR